MKKVYKSFESKLDVDCQEGYTISELGDFYQVDFLSVWQDCNDTMVRIKKEFLPESDFSDIDKIMRLKYDIEHGRRDVGRCFYKGKWYGYDTINKIMAKTGSDDWRWYVK